MPTYVFTNISSSKNHKQYQKIFCIDVNVYFDNPHQSTLCALGKILSNDWIGCVLMKMLIMSVASGEGAQETLHIIIRKIFVSVCSLQKYIPCTENEKQHFRQNIFCYPQCNLVSFLIMQNLYFFKKVTPYLKLFDANVVGPRDGELIGFCGQKCGQQIIEGTS